MQLVESHEAPIELEAAPTSVDGYLAHLSYDENTPFQANQELYDVDIVEGPAEITFSLEIEDDEQASLIEIHPQTGVITAVDDFHQIMRMETRNLRQRWLQAHKATGSSNY